MGGGGGGGEVGGSRRKIMNIPGAGENATNLPGMENPWGRGQTGENPLWGVMDIFWVPHVTIKPTLTSDSD